MPGGTKSVALKLKDPSSCICAKNIGFNLDGRSMLILNSV